MSTRLHTSFPILAAEVNDLLERPLPGALEVEEDGSVVIRLRPFQVMTIRLRRR